MIFSVSTRIFSVFETILFFLIFIGLNCIVIKTVNYTLVQILLPLCWQSKVLVIAKHVLFIEILSNSPRFIHKWINFSLLILQWDLGEASIHIRAINMYNNHPYQGDPAGRGWWKPYEGEFHQNPEVFRLLHESFWQKQGRHRNRGDVLQQNIEQKWNDRNEMTMQIDFHPKCAG